MNFDELKSEWDSENADDVHIPQNTNALKAARHPLQALKRTMKNELILQLAGLAAFVFLPFLLGIDRTFYLVYYLGFMVILVISGYYLIEFRKFYRQVDHFELATKDSLTAIYYDLRLNMERYKSWGFLLTPFGLFVIGIFFYSRFLRTAESWMPTETQGIIIFIGCFSMLLLIIWSINWWLQYYYGRYADQLKALLDALREDR